MIFVKETRPKIVTANPDMGALEVMQEVGRAWQSMVEHDRKYFKDKADNDKHRYLDESRRFYDEVARIGMINLAKDQEMAKPATSMGDPKNGGSKPKDQDSAVDDETLAGKKRLAHKMAKKVLVRSSSMSLTNPNKRVPSSVMAIGLAPDGSNMQDVQASAHKRLRAESKFTFRPDVASDDDRECSYPAEGGFENEEDGDDNEDLDGLCAEGVPPETAL